MKVKKFKIQAEVITCDQDGWLDNESLQEAMGYIAANWESTGMGSCFIPCNTLKSQELKVSEKDVKNNEVRINVIYGKIANVCDIKNNKDAVDAFTNF